MATQSFTIVSHYTPPKETEGDDESLSDGDSDEVDEQEKIWRTGPLYKSRSSESEAFVSHRAAYPPRFVPALLSADDYSTPELPGSSPAPNITKTDNNDTKIGSWYKGLLTTSATPREGEPTTGASKDAEMPFERSRIKSLSRPAPQTASSPSSTLQTTTKKRKVRPNDWFIQNSLPKSSLSFASTTNLSASSSITDILTRNPPPLPDSGATPYVPPLRTKLGPGNRGYAILAQKGWREGEGLGSWRTVPVSDENVSEAGPSRTHPSSGPSEPTTRGPREGEVRQITHRRDESEVIDLTVSEVIDLTVSDDDSDSAWESDDDSIIPTSTRPAPKPVPLPPQHQPDDHGRTVLITPLNTYLKADRLGIGATRGSSSRQPPGPNASRAQGSQKSATSPPARPKPKPFTDTSQAMHTDRERKRMKREHEHRVQMLRLKGGKRGSKGFASVKQDEERRRKDLLAYMNS